MSDQTIIERILSAIAAGLGAVLQANGYRTDIGASVAVGVLSHDPNSAPMTVVVPLIEDVSGAPYRAVDIVAPIRIEAFSTWSGDAPTATAMAMLADLIECMTATTWSLPFTSGAVEIAVGDTVTGASSKATGYVAGVAVSSGSWAGGDAAGAFALRRVTGAFAAAEDIKLTGVVATGGAAVGQHAAARMTDGLASRIVYAQGGQDDFPGLSESLVGVSAQFNVEYRTVVGDPYHQ